MSDEKRILVITIELPASINERSTVSGLSSYLARWGGTITGWSTFPSGLLSPQFVSRVRRSLRRRVS